MTYYTFNITSFKLQQVSVGFFPRVIRSRDVEGVDSRSIGVSSSRFSGIGDAETVRVGVDATFVGYTRSGDVTGDAASAIGR